MHANRDDLNAYHREYHAKLRARGICITCLSPSGRFWRCLTCRRRQAKYKNRAYRARINPCRNNASLSPTATDAQAVAASGPRA